MITRSTPASGALDAALAALGSWQVSGAPFQLHPGDVGWYQRFGADAVAAAVRCWARDGRLLAVGLLDGADLLRVALAPEAQHDDELCRAIADDADDPDAGLLPAGQDAAEVTVEAPAGSRLRELLVDRGWRLGETWTPLLRDLADPVEPVRVRVEVVDADLAAERVAVQRAVYARSVMTVETWQGMAAGPAYREARCLLAFDEDGAAAAAITVWSAGEGRLGLIEPMGVAPEFRGRGFGRAITLAGASALRDLGASAVIVATPSENRGGVAAYRAAGFTAVPDIHDLVRSAAGRGGRGSS